MPNTTITFNVNDRNARQGFERMQRELNETQRAAHRTNTTFRDSNGRLRDMRGRFVAAGQGADVFTKSLGGARGLLTGLGVAVVGRELLEFGAASVRAAGQMEGLERALEAIEGENATQRLRDFNEIAKLPGLNTPQIIRYSNSLRAAGATTSEVDAIITTFGQSIVGLGGNAADTSRAMLQLTQAFGENKISQENFSTIKELIPSFNRLAKEVYNTDGSMDALNKRFKASGQTLGQFLLPILARLRQEIPAAPVDSYARSIDALGEEFQQFKIAIGTELLPVISATARGLASLFNTMTKGVQVVGDFFDVVDEKHHALLNASESAREFSIRLKDINTAAGQQEAVTARIQTLYRLIAALRTEQSQVSQSSKEYLNFAERIRDANNELDTLREIQGTRKKDNRDFIGERTEALERTNAEIQRYEALLASARQEAVGRTNPAIQQLERRLEASRATAEALTREIALLKNGFQDIVPTAATQAISNQVLELEKLKAAAEDTRRAFTGTSGTDQQVAPNFQAALSASNAYYNERIRQAETALAKEKEGTEAFNELQVQIFQLGRQRVAAQRQLEAERTNILRTFSRERVTIEQTTNNEIIAGFSAIVQAAREAFRARAEFARQVAAIPDIRSPEAQYGNFTSQLRRDFEATERQGHRLLGVMREIANFAFGGQDLEDRLPDPIAREANIDERIAEEVRGAETLNAIRQEAGRQGRQFVNQSLRSEERAVQASLRKQARSYRQFANLVSNTFINLATGRTQSFEQVATAFIQQSLRIVLRAYIEYQIQKRLDDTLTASKIANIQKVNAARAAGGGIGNLLGNLPGTGNLGNLFSGGGLALGASALLFPNESSNLLSGIKDDIGGFLSNIGDVPDRAFGARQQVFLKIGENEVRDITDIQDDLREEDRV